MHCLWLTFADPDPALNGQFIYSKGLIDSVHGAGAVLDVVGLARDGQARSPDRAGLTWHLTDERCKPRALRLLSPMPALPLRASSQRAKQNLERLLAQGEWDAIVFDSICGAWALDPVLRHRRRTQRPPRIVYLAHNHETTVARHISSNARGLVRLVRTLDSLKVDRLERRLVHAADLVTANSPEDCRLFRRQSGAGPVALLLPGYGGDRVVARHIGQSTPRRAVIVGSFDWPPKRMSLESFLTAASPIFLREAIELVVVGDVDGEYLAGMRRCFPAVLFAGPVDDVRGYMASARVALVPDMLGGFKLKGLDYVFNRIPIMAMRGSLPGMPLRNSVSIGEFESHADLATGVAEVIDDFEILNRRQEAAYDACAHRFDWDRIGNHFLRLVERLRPGSSSQQSHRRQQVSP